MMSDKVAYPRAVIFDVDGVLIDSLKTHLKFCRDMAVERNLQIDIPSEENFRERVSKGLKVSPMRNFFVAVGFPEAFLDRLDAEYELKFDPKYRGQLFLGAREMLKTLHRSGVRLGLVTSNSKKNVESALGYSIVKLFHPNSLFYREGGKSKSQLIKQAMYALGVEGSECVYVGDQPDDLSASKEAGCRFVGVTYGWGFVEGSHDAEMASSPSSVLLASRRATKDFPIEQQLEYAWNWFGYHADQRVKMFNYMFVGLGLFATAIITALDKGLHKTVPITLCIVAGILAVAFHFLDKRNEYLLGLGEEVLFGLEKTNIFGPSVFVNSRFDGIVTKGILLRQQREHPLFKNRFRLWLDHFVKGRHRFWLRRIAALLAIMFFLAALALVFFEVKPSRSNFDLELFLREFGY